MIERELDTNYTAGANPDPTDHFDPETRRIEDVAGVPVVLADGRTWFLASATERYRPVFEGDQFVGVEVSVGFPAPVERVADKLRKAVAADSDAVPVNLIFASASALLRRCHNLSAPETAALLSVDDAQFRGITVALAAAFQGDAAGDGPWQGGE